MRGEDWAIRGVGVRRELGRGRLAAAHPADQHPLAEVGAEHLGLQTFKANDLVDAGG